MNQREKLLAKVVGVLVAVTVLFYGGKKIANVLISRADQIVELKKEVETKEVQRRRGVKAGRVLSEYANRALPSDQFFADSRYREWLHQWVQSADINGADVKWVNVQTIKIDKDHAHDIHNFVVMCEGDLPQLVKLLYGFYSQDYLHRIKLLHAKPVKDKRLSLKFTIEAIAMPTVPDKTLENMPSKRLAFESIDKYQEVIAGRNLYSPANQPPNFARAETQEGYVHQRMRFKPDVRDPESGRLTYRLEHDGLEGVRIDQRSGEIEWTPSEIGEFEIMVYATDDGLPAKEASQTIHLAVSEPPPEPVREDPPPRRTFDEAKYTFVTGIVEVNGRRQVWLTVRTDGKWLRLFEGDTFQIGSLDGKILKIHPRHVEILTDQTVYAVRFGKSLNDGEVLNTGDEEVAATGK